MSSIENDCCTIETQLIETIFSPKFTMERGLSSENQPLVSQNGASIIENNISTIEYN